MSKKDKGMAPVDAATPAAPAAPAAPKVEKIVQNGVSRPGVGTATERIWAIADELSTAAGAAVKRAPVLTQAENEGLNVTTAATQYGRWCKFHGIKAAPKEAKEPAAPKAPKAPKVKKEVATGAAAEPAAEPAAQ